jgi:primosomal protein N' (replication factor Y)
LRPCHAAAQGLPECGEEDSLVACGPASSASPTRSPSCSPTRGRRSSPATPSGRRARRRVRRRDGSEAIDIVIGTQLVTKGYHFPNLTLVGVVDADLGLPGGDLRAAERSFQQIQQVAGRAGRGDKPGRVLVQTTTRRPGHCGAGLRRRPGFYAAETEARREAACRRSVGSRRSSSRRGLERSRSALRAASAVPRPTSKAWRLRPRPAPLAMLRGRHRQRLLVHAAEASTSRT